MVKFVIKGKDFVQDTNVTVFFVLVVLMKKTLLITML